MERVDALGNEVGVVVDVSRDHRAALQSAVDAGIFGHITEGAVGVVSVERVGVAEAVGEEDVEPAVSVEVWQDRNRKITINL